MFLFIKISALAKIAPSSKGRNICSGPGISAVCQISLVPMGAPGICQGATAPWFRSHLGRWDWRVEVVRAPSRSRKPPSDSWRGPGLCDLALTPKRHMEARYHLLTQLLFSFLMTGICTVFNANRGNTFIALSKKF